MKKTLLCAAVMMALALPSVAQNFETEEIPYDVRYHWGLINKVIGHGVVKIECRDGNFRGTLFGQTQPFEGRIFMVQDTLHARMASGGNVFASERVSFKRGWYFKPTVTQINSRRFNKHDPSCYKNTSGGGSLDASHETMEAVEITVDMLGMFYQFREVNFQAIKPGATYRESITLPGGGTQYVYITYIGPSEYHHGGRLVPTYKLKFEYTYGSRRTDYPVTCQIDRTSRIPLMLEADLMIGHVEMVYSR